MVFLKKNWFLILLAMVAVTMLAFWIYLRIVSPRQPPTPSLPPPESQFSEKTTLGVYNIVAAQPTVPETLPVFSTKTFSKDTIPQALKKLAADFNISLLAPIIVNNEAIVWSSEQNSIVLNIPSGRFSITGKNKVSSSFDKSSAQSYAIKKAQLLDLPGDIINTNIKEFVVSGNDLQEVHDGTGSVFVVSLFLSLNKLPIVLPSVNQAVLEFRLTKDGSFVGFSANINTPEVKIGEYKTKSFTEITNELQRGNAKTLWVIDKDGNTAPPLSIAPIIKGEVSKIYLGYFESLEKQKFFQPIFVFEGDGQTVSGNLVKFALFVPAI